MQSVYREEHLELLSKLPGYRRSLRYKLSQTQMPLTKGSGPEEVQPWLSIHEIDDVRHTRTKVLSCSNHSFVDFSIWQQGSRSREYYNMV